MEPGFTSLTTSGGPPMAVVTRSTICLFDLVPLVPGPGLGLRHDHHLLGTAPSLRDAEGGDTPLADSRRFRGGFLDLRGHQGCGLRG